MHCFVLGVTVSSSIFLMHEVFLSFLNRRMNLQLNLRMIVFQFFA